MSLMQLTVQRKKRRTKKPGPINQCDTLKVEDQKISAFNVDFSNKRSLDAVKEPHTLEALPLSSHRYNYSEMFNDAEKRIVVTPKFEESSSCESPKESEIDDFVETPISSQNDIDINKSWDYYQIMYTEEEGDGDSRILESDTIKNWEPDMDTFDIFDTPENKLSIWTSGYETSPDLDAGMCVKSIECVLEFSAKSHSEIATKIDQVAAKMRDAAPSLLQLLLGAMAQYCCIAHMNLSLIKDISESDDCIRSHASLLFNDLKRMESRWDSLIHDCFSIQLNTIMNRMESWERYNNEEELKLLIYIMQKMITTLGDVSVGLTKYRHVDIGLQQIVHGTNERLEQMKEVRKRELDIFRWSMASVEESKRARHSCGCNIGSGIVDGSNNHGPNNIWMISLEDCNKRLLSIVNSSFQTDMLSKIDKEILAWKEMCQSLSEKHQSVLFQEDKDLVPAKSSYHLPLYVFIFILCAFIFVVYQMIPRHSCQLSTYSLRYLRMFHRRTDHLEPH